MLIEDLQIAMYCTVQLKKCLQQDCISAINTSPPRSLDERREPAVHFFYKQLRRWVHLKILINLSCILVTVLILCPFAVYFVRYWVRLFFTIPRIFLVSGTIKWRQQYIMYNFQHYVPLTSLYSPALWNALKVLATIIHTSVYKTKTKNFVSCFRRSLASFWSRTIWNTALES